MQVASPTPTQVRLVTITGPGGMGKTSLALAAAAKQLESTSGHTTFPHGLYFVSLAPLADSGAIISAIAEAIGFTFYEGAPPQQQLLDTLREKQLLLILDNFEHLLAGATLVDSLLQTAPGGATVPVGLAALKNWLTTRIVWLSQKVSR